MDVTHDSRETWDRLTLLLIARPTEGWEDIFEEITRREIERLASHPGQEESPVADQSTRGEKDGTETKENSAYGCIIHNA